MPRLAEGLLGGWRISSVITLQSGQWYTPSFDGFDPSNTNNPGGRPDRVVGASLNPTGGQTITDWFNAAAFAIPGCPVTTSVCAKPVSPGRFGNAGNNILEGPPTKNIDLALMKVVHLTERLKLEFQSIFSNAFNHPNFSIPAADISALATVGQITSTSSLYIPGSGTSRSIHLSLRLRF
jgi:hypothetical protein